jgi:protein arginine kinase
MLKEIDVLLSQKQAGSTKKKDQIIISSSAAIARNLSDYKFNTVNDKSDKNKIMALIKDTKASIKELDDYKFYALKDLTRIQRQSLIEKKLMSSEMSKKLFGKAIILDLDSKDKRKLVSILINDKDHLRIQCSTTGLGIVDCYSSVLKIEKKMEKKLSFSFDRHLGYLTSNPANIGTAFKVSMVAHLPGLVISAKIIDFIKKINKIGCFISGFFGEGAEVVGNLFAITNQTTLGKTEKEIINEMEAIAQNVIEEEQNEKLALKSSKNITLIDSVYRSYGMLKYAKVLSYDESLELISILKLGLDIKIIDNIKKFDFYRLINIINDSNIELCLIKKNMKVTEDEIDFERANIIRKNILKGLK